MLSLQRVPPALLLVAALLWLPACASRMDAPPPLPVVPAANSPDEVRQALPGTWSIAVNASAEALARAQYQPRTATLMRREGMASPTQETATVAERFDPNAFVEARAFWRSALKEPDMRWRLVFHADGTGTHWAVTTPGQPVQPVPFQWRLNGWQLQVDYQAGAPFKSFTTEMRSAVEIRYPMQPLGDYVILQRAK